MRSKAVLDGGWESIDSYQGVTERFRVFRHSNKGTFDAIFKFTWDVHFELVQLMILLKHNCKPVGDVLIRIHRLVPSHRFTYFKDDSLGTLQSKHDWKGGYVQMRRLATEYAYYTGHPRPRTTE